ncbi:signal recognition particle-docking protein FtsY [Candidatus Pacearchaeota archaeon]|nr:signal recognition particle-docking protein FtsY [Candidatus Pacearchaeota archaeon]
MFGKLKEKLKTWTKKVSEKTRTPDKKEVKGIKLPTKFDPGRQKFEPDLRKLQEIEQTIKKGEGLEKKSKDIVKKGLEVPLKEIDETVSSIAPQTSSEPGTESFFKKVTSKISKTKISEKDFEIYGEELEMLLLENNVAVEVAEKVIKKLKEKIIGKELLKKEVEEEIKGHLKEIINDILIEPFNLIEKIDNKKSDQSKEPYVVLFCGINGTGKTTSIAKIAKYLKKKDISCVLAAADTFRAASIEQIEKHGNKLGIKVISNKYGSDPASVGFDAIQYAKKNMIDCVLIDTAGRMHTSKNLLREIEKIAKVCKPDIKIFVGEAIAGNDILEQVRNFDWAIGIDGIILTKADTDEKGGTALSVGYTSKKPILFLGTGQEYEKIEVFSKRKFVKELGL